MTDGHSIGPGPRGTQAAPDAGTEPPGSTADAVATRVVAALTQRGETVAVAESLTGGLVVASLVSVPGASRAVHGGVVAYATPVKASVLGVSASLLASNGAVDPTVAEQMAAGVRDALAVGGRAATWGISTTGVAGPEPQDGQAVGTVFIGIASADGARSFALRLDGDREAIRRGTVSELLTRLADVLGAVDPVVRAGE